MAFGFRPVAFQVGIKAEINQTQMDTKILGQLDLLLFVASLFRKAKIPLLLTGSLAVSYYGYPRATHDIDFVILTSESTRRNFPVMMSGFGKGFIHDPSSLTEIDTLYALYHADTAIKVDIWLEKEKDFENKWKRKRMMVIQGHRIAVVSPEDLILKKLSWCKEVWSDRHFRDCVGIWKVQQGQLGERYLKDQASKINVLDLLGKIKDSQYELL